jgi:thiol:disulfide interchange protein DsbC
MTRPLLTWLLMVVVTAAGADEAAVRRMLQGTVGGEATIESVQKAPFGDLYEVVLRGPDGMRIVYVDNAASVILAGPAIDPKSGRNLTEERQRKLSAIKWSSLPFDDAITIVRGNGRRKIAVFSDPNCPFCKRFEKDLANLDDSTVHIFLFPVIRPESVPQTKAVWCSPDRAKAWRDLMLRGVQPSAKPDCNTPVEKLVALGRSLGANATPTWFDETGERYSGALALDDVRKILDEASPPKR